MRIPRSILRRTAAVLLCITAVTIGAEGALAGTGNPGGACSTAETGNWIMSVYRHAPYVAANYFDAIFGDATVQPLDVCATNAPNATGTYILPANVEKLGGGNHTYQLGYGKGYSSQGPKFVYVLATNGNPPIMNEISGVAPVYGHRYRFNIYKRSSGYVSFDIYDFNTSSFVWTYYPTVSWASDNTLAWWGYELLDKNSRMGSCETCGDIDMNTMGYSKDTTTANYWRDGLYCDGAPLGNDYDVQKQFTWDGDHTGIPCANPPYANITGVISSMNWDRDTFEAFDPR